MNSDQTNLFSGVHIPSADELRRLEEEESDEIPFLTFKKRKLAGSINFLNIQIHLLLV